MDAVWISFEGSNKAKPVPRADLEFAAEETEMSIGDPDGLGFVEDLFDVKDNLDDGDILAMYEALLICNEQQLPLPTWLNSGIQDLVIAVALGNDPAPRGVGRSNSTTGRNSEELKLYLRKEAVKRVRWYQLLGPCHFAFFLLPVGLKRIHANKAPPDLGRTLALAIEHAARSLRGTFAQASTETIRKAHFAKCPDGWGTWILSRHETLTALGVEVDNGDFLPAGFAQSPNFGRNDNPTGMGCPTQIISGWVSGELDEQSVSYIEMAKGFGNFEDFMEKLRRDRSAEKG